MKIALVSQEYPPETAHGGIATQTYSKAKGLAGLGHEVYVISRSISTTRQEISDGNITTIRIPGMDQQLPEMTEIVHWITHSVVVAVELENLHKRIGFDIIDFPEWAAESYTWLLNRTAWKTIPTVIQLHGPLVMLAHTVGWPGTDTSFYKIGIQMEAECIKQADSIYSSSKCTANWIHSYYDKSKINIPVIHLGIDTKKFYPLRSQDKKPTTILFVGKLVQNKGVEELIEATSQLRLEFPDLCLKIVGRGEEQYLDNLKKKAAALEIMEMVEFTGFMNKEELPAVLSRASVFAAPSYYEGGPGFVYLEAMACGIPVIGCSGSGIDEIIEHEVTGMLVPPKNIEALTEALQRVLKDIDFSKQMGMNARNFILRESDSDHCLKKLEEYYYSVINMCSKESEKS